VKFIKTIDSTVMRHLKRKKKNENYKIFSEILQPTILKRGLP